MKELDELDLKPKDLLKVRRWLDSWYQHFNSMADNAKATVERYDLEKLDFFYFTECIDILSKNPESKGVEDNKVIQKRKRAVEYSLIFRRLLGEELNKKRPCSHCGNDDRVISSLGDGTGHYVFCEKCAMTVIVTYPVGYETCIKRVCEDLTKRGLATKLSNKEEFDKLLEEVKASVKKNENHYHAYVNGGGTLTYDDWLTVEDANKKIIEKKAMATCDTCGFEGKINDNFNFAVGLCNSCYKKEVEGLEEEPKLPRIRILDESLKKNQPPKKKGRTVPLNG